MTKRKTITIFIALIILLIITNIFNGLKISQAITKQAIVSINVLLILGIITSIIYYTVKYINKANLNKGYDTLSDWVTFVSLAIASILFVTTYIISTSKVSGTSMYPTLEDKQFLLVYYFNYEAKREDLIIIKEDDIDGSLFLVKRVIALPGDKITFVRNGFESNYLIYLNDSNEPVIDGYNEPYTIDEKDIEYVWHRTLEVYLDNNQIFILGDNSKNSKDSKQKGLYDLDNVIGKVVWPNNERKQSK